MSKQNIKVSVRLHIKLLCTHNSNTPPLHGVPTLRTIRKKIEMVQRRAARWTMNDYSPYSSVIWMQQDLHVGWRRWKRGGMMLVFVCFIKLHMAWLPSRCLHISSSSQRLFVSLWHPLVYHQVNTSANYYKYSFFVLAFVQWNTLSPTIVMLPTLTLFSVAVRSLDHHLP